MIMLVNGVERDYVVHDNDNVKGFFGDYRWLSNFHKCPIWFDGYQFPATENAYVYAKIAPAKIIMMKEAISYLQQCEPHESKKFGQSMEVREDWSRVKYDVMSAVVFDKFYRHVELRHRLLATGHKLLEETNHWSDKYWGVCNGAGQNKLGKIHMSIREYWGREYPDLLGKKNPTKLL